MKTVLFAPGFKGTLRGPDHAGLLKTIEAEGYKTVFVPITWERTTIDNWLLDFKKVYAKYDPDSTILAGFSYGAMTVLLAAAERPPAELWLFSLSPWFAEDIPQLKKHWVDMRGKRRMASFGKLHFNQLAPKITSKTLILLGETEAKRWPVMVPRSHAAHTLIKNSRLVMAPGADHNITSPTYIQAISQAI